MLSIIDYREEFFVRLYRGWLIISILGLNKRGECVLSIPKAAFFDFLVKNPKSLHEFLVKFGRLTEEAPYKNILYSSNVGYGASQDHQDFLKSALVLESEGYIKITHKGDEFLVAPADKRFPEKILDTCTWRLDIELLKPLVGKSLSVLHKGIISK
jgi:hypothetical protein